jgi:hypothetical protein
MLLIVPDLSECLETLKNGLPKVWIPPLRPVTCAAEVRLVAEFGLTDSIRTPKVSGAGAEGGGFQHWP